jgi:3-phytase
VTAPDAPLVFSADQAEVNTQTTAYGLATWHDRKAGGAWAFVSQRHRRVVAKARLVAEGEHVTYRVVASLTLPGRFRLPDGTTWEPCGEPGEQPQVEGMVVDTRRQVLYAAQEDVGVWRMGVDLDRTRPALVDRVREYGSRPRSTPTLRSAWSTGRPTPASGAGTCRPTPRA